MKFLYQIAISLGLLCLSAMAYADVGGENGGGSNGYIEQLQLKLNAIDHIVAQFEQSTADSYGDLVEVNRGSLQLAKPNLRWEVREPFPQIILVQANQVEIYDPDLEQVTQKTLGTSLHEAPLSLLTQRDLSLAEHFTVISADESAQLYVLLPKADDALFQRLSVQFANGQLKTLVIYDHSGRRTDIHFSQYLDQQVIQSSVFEMEYPDGTDFVRG